MVNRVRYCGGPAVGLLDWLRAGGAPDFFSQSWPQLRGRTVIGTFRGRTAIALACQLLGIGQGDEVLVPAYNCGTEIDAILYSGASIVSYQVSRRCEIELEDLVKRRTSRTKAVYVIHYFGWEQSMRELRAWCNQEGLLLIEDCALALFSAGQAGMVGQLSDAAIYSLPKTLGLAHGGLLSLPAARKVDLPRLTVPGFSVLANEIKSASRSAIFNGLDRVGLYGLVLAMRHHLRGRRGAIESDESFVAMPVEYNFDPVVDLNRALHPRAAGVARTLEWQPIVDRRRANYAQFAAALGATQKVASLFPHLPERVCPLSFPLLVSSRDATVAELQARGIAALPWWAGFHQGRIDWSQFSDACWLKRHLLTVPVQQGLDSHQMSYIAEIFRQIFSR